MGSIDLGGLNTDPNATDMGGYTTYPSDSIGIGTSDTTGQITDSGSSGGGVNWSGILSNIGNLANQGIATYNNLNGPPQYGVSGSQYGLNSGNPTNYLPTTSVGTYTPVGNAPTTQSGLIGGMSTTTLLLIGIGVLVVIVLVVKK